MEGRFPPTYANRLRQDGLALPTYRLLSEEDDLLGYVCAVDDGWQWTDSVQTGPVRGGLHEALADGATLGRGLAPVPGESTRGEWDWSGPSAGG